MMKNLKMSMYLLLTAAIFTSCEKETIALPENSEMNVQRPKEILPQKPMSLFGMMQSGVNMDAYFRSLQKTQSKMAKQTTAQRAFNTNVEFYDSAEEFDNNTLPTEDFEDAQGYTNSGFFDYTVYYPENPEYVEYNYYYNDFYSNAFPKLLNENNLYGVFNEGDFTSGISFELIKNEYAFENSWWRDYYSVEQLEEWMDNYGFYIQSSDYQYVYHPEWNSGNSKTLFSNYDFTDLVIKFSDNNVNSVSLNILYGGNITFHIYDTSGNLLATDNTYIYNGYWGVTSKVSIGKIVMISDYNNENVDNVSFGFNADFDGDGVLNANDAHPNSDLRRGLNIGGIKTKIDNKMVKNGSTMMDQLNDLIAQTNAQYNGQNYDYLHKRFMTELAQLTYNWRMARLITATQRSQISSIAWSATIPYMYN